MTKYDVIIIGAGPSGLAAGIRLAYYGKKVCILEQHFLPGGLNSYYRQGGYNFDVGLHAMTNFPGLKPNGKAKTVTPMTKLLRQLRIKVTELDLIEQHFSHIAFPGKTINFTNNPEQIEAEIQRLFPREIEGFRNLVQSMTNYNDISNSAESSSARQYVRRFIHSEELIDMLFCPLCFYGSSMVNDIEMRAFSILFRSIYLEGFCRPAAGMRHVIDLMVHKFKENGGELRFKSKVTSISSQDKKFTHVELEDGTKLAADHLLSSAGFYETMNITDALDYKTQNHTENYGQLSFIETIFILDEAGRKLLADKPTITFFNNTPKFNYAPATELVDHSSGVMCLPNRFDYTQTDTPEEQLCVRVTSIANYDKWHALSPEDYKQAKIDEAEKQLANIAQFIPNLKPHIIYTDTFTPTTIERFTGHYNGAVYGAPEKHFSGITDIENLLLCGTDQGLLGIIGAGVSGITMVNSHIFR